MNNYISIGKILNFHGVQGEAKVGYSKSQAEFLSTLKKAFIYKDDEYLPFKVKNVKFNNKFAIIKFENVNSINEISEYKNCLIYVEETEIKDSLETDEFLIDDLIGVTVFCNDKKIGAVIGISNNGATDLLAIKSLANKVSYVPFVKALVPEVDLANKKIVVSDIEGLIE